jgi:1-acyl-sn-glycerol-3-phosphate acyltransferase
VSRRIDHFLKRVARFVLEIFFRRIEVVGEEQVPTTGPVVFVGNHPNGLVDAFAVMGLLPRQPRFLGKSTLWQSPLLKPLLQLARVIPVQRAQDGGDMQQNRAAFGRCFDELAEGGCIALFPEGVSVHEPEMRPLKTGAARITLEAEAARGPLGVALVPFGLHFEDRSSFRSRLLLCVGEPIDPGAQIARHARDERGAVQALTDRIREALAAITLNQESWQEMRLVERAAEVYARGTTPLPGRLELAQGFPLRHSMGDAYAELRHEQPEKVEALRSAVSRYDAALSRAGLRDDQIAADYPWREALGYLARRLPWLPLWLPAAAVGVLLNWLPYRVPALVARLARTDATTTSTVKLLTGLVVMPLCWLLEAIAAGLWLGAGWGCVVAGAGPASGWLALRFHERAESLVGELRAWLVIHLRRRRTEALRRLRADIQQQIAVLARDRA